MAKPYEVSLTEQFAKTIHSCNLLIQDLCTLEGMLKDAKDATQKPQIVKEASNYHKEAIDLKGFLEFVSKQKGAPPK